MNPPKKYPNHNYNKSLKKRARHLRKNATKAEIILWKDVLSGRKMKDYQFLRQRPIQNYIVDFMNKELSLIIEVDGYSHHEEERWKNDVIRQKKLESLGFVVLRFTDEEVLKDIDQVAMVIESWILANS